MTVRILQGDTREILKTLSAESIQTCVTSPPYYGLRSYLPDGHPDKGHEIGLEQSPQEYVDQLVAVFREVRRVLRKDATCWLNLGDSYNAAGRIGHGTRIGYKQGTNRASGSGQDHTRATDDTLKPKDLLLIPARVAIALQADGWWVRSEIIWSKAAPMPESVRDRPTCAHEKVWLLTRSERYFYDADAVAEPVSQSSIERLNQPTLESQIGSARANGGAKTNGNMKAVGGTETRNLRNVWHLGPAPCNLAHFATMPPTLAERCIKAGTSEKGCCPTCGAPWTRQIEVESRSNAPSCNGKYDGNGKHRTVSGGVTQDARKRTDLGWRPSCSCPAHEPVPQTVLDPFAGAGTTLLVADRLQRHGIGIELNPEYIAIAQERLRTDAPLFAEVA